MPAWCHVCNVGMPICIWGVVIMNQKTGKKTLLMSVIMSAPGPLIIGLGLLEGQSTTQIADFVRRSVELLSIILSYVVYCITTKAHQTDDAHKERLEYYTNVFVSLAMIVSGAIMLILVFFSNKSEKGNVVPGLLIAVLGMIANTLFWRKYAKLSRIIKNAILLVQSKLYRAKSFVDISVTIALLVVLLLPTSPAALWFDAIGTISVSCYLMYSGIRSLRKTVKNTIRFDNH